jgi:hypothetical protein
MSKYLDGDDDIVWSPLSPTKTKNLIQKLIINPDYSTGKISINSHLSHSTDDLLKLARGGRFERDGYSFSPDLDSRADEEKEFGDGIGLEKYSNFDTPFKPLNAEELDDFVDTEFDGDFIYQEGDEGDEGDERDEKEEPFQNEEEVFIPEVFQVAPPPQTKLPPCTFFKLGFCVNGNFCSVSHYTPYATDYLDPAEISKIYLQCRDQQGCRCLQKDLDEGDEKVVNMIFNGVIPYIIELMSDPFGNYLCQKLIEYCNPHQIFCIVRDIAPNFIEIAQNMHGTRAVQKLIEHLDTPDQIQIAKEAIKGSVVPLIRDLNGNHVIQKCLKQFKAEDNQFIYDAVADKCFEVASHKHGCCVFQRCVDAATYEQQKQMTSIIKRYALELVQDPYGNYVVQYALDLKIPGFPTHIIKKLEGKLFPLSVQKHSSNVVEKCLIHGNAECVMRIMRELLHEDPNPNNPGVFNPDLTDKVSEELFQLLEHSFGNYVIQTCLSEGITKAPNEFVQMSKLLKPLVSNLRNIPYIKRIKSLLNPPGIR